MSQVITGSIATDDLMVFPGRFTEQLIEGKLDKVSLSFLVDELKIHRGGIAANIAFGMAGAMNEARQIDLAAILRSVHGADIVLICPDDPEAELAQIADPTGAGDAFRAGFLAGICRGLGHESSAQLGCVMAALVMETTGTQEYRFDPDRFLARVSESYGAEAAAEVAASMSPASTREWCSVAGTRWVRCG
jgi:hypothetical protein